MRMNPRGLLGRLWKPQIVWKGGRCLALCISPTEFLLAELFTGSDGKPQVEKFQRVAFDVPAQANFFETGFMQEKEKWLAGLQNALSQMQVGSGQPVIVALSQHLALLRYFAMPKTPRQFWKRAIPQEAKKYIPFAFENLVVDFQVQDNAGADDVKTASEVLFGATSNKIMEQVRTLSAEAGLELLAVEPMGCSAARSWQSMGIGAASPYPVITLGGDKNHRAGFHCRLHRAGRNYVNVDKFLAGKMGNQKNAGNYQAGDEENVGKKFD